MATGRVNPEHKTERVPPSRWSCLDGKLRRPSGPGVLWTDSLRLNFLSVHDRWADQCSSLGMGDDGSYPRSYRPPLCTGLVGLVDVLGGAGIGEGWQDTSRPDVADIPCAPRRSLVVCCMCMCMVCRLCMVHVHVGAGGMCLICRSERRRSVIGRALSQDPCIQCSSRCTVTHAQTHTPHTHSVATFPCGVGAPLLI
jgi:hypothetical protein